MFTRTYQSLLMVLLWNQPPPSSTLDLSRSCHIDTIIIMLWGKVHIRPPVQTFLQAFKHSDTTSALCLSRPPTLRVCGPSLVPILAEGCHPARKNATLCKQNVLQDIGSSLSWSARWARTSYPYPAEVAPEPVLNVGRYMGCCTFPLTLLYPAPH